MRKFFCLISFSVFFSVSGMFAQDSLYLVDTLTGTATNNKLRKAEGIGDFNGDGLADFIICYDQYVDLYFGNPQFKPQLAHRFFQSAANSVAAYGIGDVNGDGYTDLMFLNGDTLYYPIYPYGEIILGGKGLDTIPKFKYYPPYYWDMRLGYGYPLGDLNGDGFNDFAVSIPYNWGDGLGKVYIFKGGKTIVDTPWVTLITTVGIGTHFFGSSVMGIADYNNDGFDDFLVTDPSLSGDSSKVYLYLGDIDVINAIPYKTLGPFRRFTEVKVAGDLNRDGKRDFILAADDTARIYLGNVEPFFFDASKLGTGGHIAVGTGGDINHDGYDDFFIGNTNHKNSRSVMVGVVVGFWGGETINPNDEAFRMEGDQRWFEYGKAINIGGDINGDGYDDVFVLQPSYPDYNNTTGKLFIYSYTKIVGINDRDINPPTEFRLNQNYPNPFNPTTQIQYVLPSSSNVIVTVYNSLGQTVKVFNEGTKEAGNHNITFNGEGLSSGIYLYSVHSVSINGKQNFTAAKKMLLLK